MGVPLAVSTMCPRILNPALSDSSVPADVLFRQEPDDEDEEEDDRKEEDDDGDEDDEKGDGYSE